MSLNIHYFTNGNESLYIVTNSGVTPIQRYAYKTKNEIPSCIRHYAPDGDPKYIGPDLASILGVQSFFYPNFPKCGHPDTKFRQCIAESCVLAPGGDWRKCRYFSGYEIKGETR